MGRWTAVVCRATAEFLELFAIASRAVNFREEVAPKALDDAARAWMEGADLLEKAFCVEIHQNDSIIHPTRVGCECLERGSWTARCTDENGQKIPWPTFPPWKPEDGAFPHYWV